ncbi:hypothetical protein UCDDS831_g04725 [Diplodia seriata]|uniref:Domain of unknown function at the cortex 1 domain-containing protein n=1 Tax=Diplodia seriata TaxID=420778 RepID=A0A0G2G9P1_9PEZI|nr:hypothetical protein UCDDS831_g04725 [Diplodia seriata]
MASRLKDAFSKASPFSRSKPKATIAETAATPANISSDATFSEAHSNAGFTDESPAQAAAPPPTSSTTTSPRSSSSYTTATSTTNTSSAATAPEPEPKPGPVEPAPAPAADQPEPDALHNRYKLHVTAGPSYDASSHTTVRVNTPHTVLVSNAHVTARVAVRHARDRYSISFSFVPKRDLPADEAVWGPDCARPVRDRLPPGFNAAVGIVKRFVDPSIEVDAYADEPWVYAPALSCWFVLRRTEELDEGEVVKKGVGVLEEGADGDGEAVREAWGCPPDAAKRRKWFVNAKRREGVVFEKGRLYQGDFFNPYLDFDKFALRLPGFSLGVLKYIDEKTHQLRWVFKNKVTGEVYFCVIFNLLFGDELKEALRAERAAEQELD